MKNDIVSDFLIQHRQSVDGKVFLQHLHSRINCCIPAPAHQKMRYRIYLPSLLPLFSAAAVIILLMFITEFRLLLKHSGSITFLGLNIFQIGFLTVLSVILTLLSCLHIASKMPCKLQSRVYH